MDSIVRFVVFMYLCTSICWSRIHNLEILNDARRYIGLNSFGFYQGGSLQVNLINFRTHPQNDSALFGFSLDKTEYDAMNSYLEGNQEKCILQNTFVAEQTFIFFKLDLKHKLIRRECNALFNNNMYIYQNEKDRDVLCQEQELPISSIVKNNGVIYYNTSFSMNILTVQEEARYNLYFHNCPSYSPGLQTLISFNMQIIEQNASSYLSAGDMPLPAVYCILSMLFLSSGTFWFFLLKRSKHPVFKIHRMMTVLVILKAASLAFCGVHYYYISRLGVRLVTWAILFYGTRMLEEVLLFIVLILIGTGWTLIKPVLTPRDKKLLMIVIPLQVSTNVAQIILDESEGGHKEYVALENVVIGVDLFCCACILFPILLSFRQFREASRTGCNTAVNLRKLKLFKHFYIVMVFYIYSTRIIVYLLKITVPFQYDWSSETFREMATCMFFVLAAYQFRPALHSLYFALSDVAEDEVVLHGTLLRKWEESSTTATPPVKISPAVVDEMLGQNTTFGLHGRRISILKLLYFFFVLILY